MRCLDAEFIDLYLENEIDAAQRAALEAHLKSCPACRRVVEERRVLLRAFSGFPAVEIPASFACSVMDRLPAPRRLRAPWAVASGTAVAGFLAGLLAYFLITGRSLADVLTSAGRSMTDTLGLAVPVLARLARLLGLVIHMVSTLGLAILKGLGVVSSLVSPAVLGLLLAGGLVISFFFIVGMKRILYPGEKP